MPAEKSKYGLIGYPVSHSLSPLMHNAAFAELGMNAVYELFPLKAEEVERFFHELKNSKSPILGLNVTIPYKETVLKYLDHLSPFADRVQAVNTVVVGKDRKLTGHNTDGPGFLTHLTELGFKTENKLIAIIGAGGAARAIISVMCLLPERPARVALYDVDPIRTENLLADYQERLDISIVEPVHDIEDLNIELADLLINATPIGMKPNDPVLVDEELLHPNLLVYDLIYNPAETKLLKAALRRGSMAANGLGMLFYQGVLSFQHWTNSQLDQSVKDKMWEGLNKGLVK